MAKVYCFFRPPGDDSTFSFGSFAPSKNGLPVDFGHFMIEVVARNRKVAFDYFPEGEKSIVKTTIDDSRRQRHMYVSFEVGDFEASGMILQIESYARQPPPYEFPYGSTCVTRSNQILSLANLGLEDVVTPDGIFFGLANARHTSHEHRNAWNASDNRFEVSVPPVVNSNAEPEALESRPLPGGVHFEPSEGVPDAGVDNTYADSSVQHVRDSREWFHLRDEPHEALLDGILRDVDGLRDARGESARSELLSHGDLDQLDLSPLGMCFDDTDAGHGDVDSIELPQCDLDQILDVNIDLDGPEDVDAR